MNYEEYIESVAERTEKGNFFDNLEPLKEGELPDIYHSIKELETSDFKKIIIRQLIKYQEEIRFVCQYVKSLTSKVEKGALDSLASVALNYVCNKCHEIGIDPDMLDLYLSEYDSLTALEVKEKIEEKIQKEDILLSSDLSIDVSLLECRPVNNYDKVVDYRNIILAKKYIDKMEESKIKEKLEICLYLAYKEFCDVFSNELGFSEEQWVKDNEYRYF